MSLWVNIAEKTKQNTCNTLEEKVINTRNLKKKIIFCRRSPRCWRLWDFPPFSEVGTWCLVVKSCSRWMFIQENVLKWVTASAELQLSGLINTETPSHGGISFPSLQVQTCKCLIYSPAHRLSADLRRSDSLRIWRRGEGSPYFCPKFQCKCTQELQYDRKKD